MKPDKPLNQTDAEVVIAELAQLTSTRVPLAPGLRAAARSARSARISHVLRSLADELERGQQLPALLENIRIPKHLRSMLQAVERTGNSPHVLFSLLEQQQQHRELRRSILVSLAYPIIVLIMSFLLLTAVMLTIVPTFKTMWLDWSVAVPTMTELIWWWSDTGIWIAWSFVLTLLAIGLVAHKTLRPAVWTGLTHTLPLFGILWRWSSAAQFARVLGTLLSHRVPLPEAVQIAADCSPDARVHAKSQQVLTRLHEGSSLSSALDSGDVLPLGALPLVRWGERNNALHASLMDVGEFLEGRLRIRVAALRGILPPLVFLFVVCAGSSVIVSVLSPLVMLIRSLG